MRAWAVDVCTLAEPGLVFMPLPSGFVDGAEGRRHAAGTAVASARGAGKGAAPGDPAGTQESWSSRPCCPRWPAHSEQGRVVITDRLSPTSGITDQYTQWLVTIRPGRPDEVPRALDGNARALGYVRDHRSWPAPAATAPRAFEPDDLYVRRGHRRRRPKSA